MTEQKQANPFVRNFIPGLIIGIICGGLAGAFLPPYLERWGMSPAPKSTGVTPRSAQPGPRDQVPSGDVKPSETPIQPLAGTPADKPAETKPPEPATTATDPATPPAPAPK